MESLTLRRIASRTATYVVVAIFALFAAFPFIWATITMFKRDGDLYNPTHNPFLFKQPATLDNLTYGGVDPMLTRQVKELHDAAQRGEISWTDYEQQAAEVWS